MNRPLTGCILLVLLMAGCGTGAVDQEDGPAASSDSATTQTSATSVSAITTRPVVTSSASAGELSTAPTDTTNHASTDVPAADVGPGLGVGYYRYGRGGLFRVVDGTETQLAVDHVVHAIDDLMGGVIYWSPQQPDDPGSFRDVYWLRADGEIATLARGPDFVALIDDRPTRAELMTTGDEPLDLVLTDLQNGDSRRIEGDFFSGDGWYFPGSYGGGMFVGTSGANIGCGGSSYAIVFWDQVGKEFSHPHNPADPSTTSFTCDLCELSAAISPDGRLLAYIHRPDSLSPNDCGPEGHESYWERTRGILGALKVIDLISGETTFAVVTQPGEFVSDFDGRYVVVVASRWWSAKWPASIIYDSFGEYPPLHFDAGVTLIRSRA